MTYVCAPPLRNGTRVQSNRKRGNPVIRHPNVIVQISISDPK